MAAIDELIEQIDNPTLRERISAEVQRMVKQKKFGLVFEEHLPERTLLYEVPVQRGSLVARNGNTKDVYQVIQIGGEMAKCFSKADKEQVEIPVSELTCVAEFGEPIYPYLEPLDSVENAPDSSLWHTLIEADNYHALQLLDYMYHGKVDCIYLDPPYNTGTKEWKYNDEYVDSNDAFCHSKWLSFMKRRLILSKKLIRSSGVIMISIGWQEVNRLMLLCKEIFPERQVVFSVIKTSGGKPKGGFNITNEYVVFVTDEGFSPNSVVSEKNSYSTPFHGMNLATFNKVQRPNQAYPIFVNDKGVIVGCGKSLAERIEDETYIGEKSDFEYDYSEAPEGATAVWPITQKGEQCVWRLIPTRLKHDWKKGYIKVVPANKKKNKNKFAIQYLSEGIIAKLESGELYSEKEYPDTDIPTLKIVDYKTDASTMPTLMDDKEFYTTKGSSDLNIIFKSKKFPYPKPLQLIKYLLAKTTRKNSLILDFFAGSGTTLHATNLLNAEDGGYRRCIMITNNEVSDAETQNLSIQGHKPGDKEWNALGIARHVTWPRTVCSIEGHDINGQPLKGNYLASDHPMSDGFPANANFFKLGFLDKDSVSRGKQLEKLIPVLWMKAGAYGKCPSSPINEEFLIYPDNNFAVLVNTKYASKFSKELPENIRVVYIVTDYEPEYRDIANSLQGKTTYQLYRDYLDNFTINTGRL